MRMPPKPGAGSTGSQCDPRATRRVGAIDREWRTSSSASSICSNPTSRSDGRSLGPATEDGGKRVDHLAEGGIGVDGLEDGGHQVALGCGRVALEPAQRAVDRVEVALL